MPQGEWCAHCRIFYVMEKFNLVLHAPEIPGNTGNIGRTAVALNLRLILIRPLGFSLDEKSLRRAGLDYWQHVNLTIYESFDDFYEGEKIASTQQLFFFSRFTKQSFYESNLEVSYEKHGPLYMVFGSETKGLPDCLWEKHEDRFWGLPMYSDKIRSLNLANCVCAVAYESMRQLLGLR